MPLKTVALATALLAGALSPTAVPAAPAARAQAPSAAPVKVDYTSFTLPNGLTTLVYTDHSVPTVFVGVWYQVGSKDEPAGRTGFAHLFEHLMFQPTIHRKGEFFLPLDKAGATGMNGTTNMDRTNFYETVPTNALDTALWMESDRMGYLGDSITQGLLDEQRAVVKNEKRQGELQPGEKARDRFLANYFPAGHPYAHSTIGSMEDIDKASLADVKQWFKQYYGASNAVLVLAGDIDVETAKQKVARYFADVPAGQPADHLQAWTPQFDHVKRDLVYDSVGSASLVRSWPLPDDPRLVTLMELAARSLAGSQNTLLQKVLVDQRRLALGVAANVSENQLSNSFDISVGLRPGVSPEEAGKAVDEVLQTYFKQGPDAQRLAAVVTATDMALLRSMENSSAIGSWMAEGYVNHRDPLYFLKQREWIAAARPEELKTLAARYLQSPYYQAVVLPSPQTASTPGSVDRKALPEPGPFAGKVVFPPISETTLANGLKIVVARRDKLPIVDASLQVNTGSLVDDRYADGAAGHAFGMLGLATRKYDTDALSRQMQRVGLTLDAQAGERQSSIGWSALSNRLDDAFALAAEIIRHPSYPQTEIDKLVDGMDAQFDAYERNPIDAAGPLYPRAIWGADSPLGRVPTREQAKRINRQTIVAFHDHEIGPNDATLFLVGDIDLARAKALAEKYFGDWARVTPSPLPAPTVPEPGTRGRVILVDAPGAAQSSISVGQTIAPFDKDSAATEALMNAALGGGFHSRLNMNLREDKGWAYGFSSSIANAPVGPRVFTASGTVETDKTAASMGEIRREIADYAGPRPIQEAELDRDKTTNIHSIPSSFNNNGSFLSAIANSAAYGLPYDRSAGAMERLQAVGLPQVRQLAARTFHPQDLTWLVVGDLKVIEQDVRALNLGPVEVWDVYGKRLR